MASPITAVNAYAKLARLADPGANPLKAGGNDSGGSFGKMVTEAITSVAERSPTDLRRAWPPARPISSMW
jgi:hypothetical protein